MNKLELIDKAVHELNGVFPKDCSPKEVGGYGVSMNVLCRPDFAMDHRYVCTIEEFQQRARELGYVNGYRFGVEYPTNGKKPDLPDDVVVSVSSGAFAMDVLSDAKVSRWRWENSISFKITDERYEPEDTSYLDNQCSSAYSSHHDVDMVALMEMEFANRSQAFKDLIGDAFDAAIDRLQSEQAEAERKRVVDAAYQAIGASGTASYAALDAAYDAGFLHMPEVK